MLLIVEASFAATENEDKSLDAATLADIDKLWAQAVPIVEPAHAMCASPLSLRRGRVSS